MLNDRMPSKAATDSRTESFKTAPENPYSSEEEDGKSTVRQQPPSTRTSQNTVRQVSGGGGGAAPEPEPQTVGLGLGLESNPEDDLTPRTRREFATFDGGWGSASEVEQEWDDNLMRNVTVKKRRPGTNGVSREVVEDTTVLPTNATMALRSVSLQESPLVYPRRRVVSDQVRPSNTSTSEASTSMDVRRSSGISTKSTVSTVVEAILVGAPPPQRRKTLRHVKKQAVLRDSGLDLSSTSIPTSLGSDDPRNQERLNGKARQERVNSIATFNSVSSHKARREVWKNGGIPVVVVPGRNSSIKSSSKEPSLRSTSSRRSKQSQSVSSGAIPASAKGTNPIFERPHRRSRALSESDGSRSGDQRTMDFPPVVPARSSSLSAPTSRNTSRAGSLTAQSLEAHNAIHAQQTRRALQALEPKAVPNESHAAEHMAVQQPRHAEPRRARHDSLSPHMPPLQSFESNHSEKEAHNHRGLHEDGYADPFSGRRLSVQRTPFSQISVETAGTSHAEVSEALAVNIYPHQNKSLLVVNHSNKPSESSSSEQTQQDTDRDTAVTETKKPNGDVPVTPPQPTFNMDDVDSPLRNPRAPPEPPAIQFIPATPSGLTPAQEKEAQLGNYFEETSPKSSQPLSILRRTLSRRRHSEYGPSATRRPSLLTRTFSLSKSVKNEGSEGSRGKAPASSAYPTERDGPADENKLHPFWRPAYEDYWDGGDGDGDGDDGRVRDTHDEEYLRYPRVDNRPNRQAPQRSLSARMKRTFAILPIRDENDDYCYELDEPGVTAHRSIRRTPSGNLRVVKHRRSVESLRRQTQALNERPYTAPDQPAGLRPRLFWRSNSVSRKNEKNESDVETDIDAAVGARPKLLPGLGNTFEKYGIHNIPRRLSERQREKRSRELRQKISGPREVRDGVGDVIRKDGWRDAFNR